LASTAGLFVISRTHQKLAECNPATFLGRGKVDEIKINACNEGAGTVIFDDELTPAQQRNLENIFGEDIKVLDRTALILDIFAQHAHTREGQIQVELAQYEYRLPRLTRMWVHLARQAGGRSAGARGGVGLRGPGETQLEVDRRQINKKISQATSGPPQEKRF
jgi:GTP-binding protein HflX